MNLALRLFYWVKDGITDRFVPDFSPSLLSLAPMAQGDLSLQLDYLNGNRHPHLRLARANAAEAQALLAVADSYLQSHITETGPRRSKLFDLFAPRNQPVRTPMQLHTFLSENFPGQVTEERVQAAKRLVNDKKGLEESHPAVPGYSQVFGKYADSNFSNAVLALSQGMRIIMKLDNPQTKFPTPRQNNDDSPLVALGSQTLVQMASSTDVNAQTRTQFLVDGMYCVSESLKSLRSQGFGKAAARAEKAIKKYLNRIDDHSTRKEFRSAFAHSKHMTP